MFLCQTSVIFLSHSIIIMITVFLYTVASVAAQSNLNFDSNLKSTAPPMEVSSCLLRCKDEHMMKMDSEWSMDFAFPLLSLLRTNGSIDAAKAKARSICVDNERLDDCLLACNASLQRKIMRIGLQPWSQLCYRIEELITQFDCWKRNVDILTLGCHFESYQLRQTMETFTHNHSLAVVEQVCRNMNVMSICNIEEYNKSCGHATKMLLIRLFRSSRDSFQEMLKIKWPKLPEACSEQIRYYAEEESALYSGTTSIFVTFAITAPFFSL